MQSNESICMKHLPEVGLGLLSSPFNFGDDPGYHRDTDPTQSLQMIFAVSDCLVLNVIILQNLT